MNIFKTIVTICAVAFLYVTVSAQDFYDEFRAKSIDVEGVKIGQKMTYDQFVAKFGKPTEYTQSDSGEGGESSIDEYYKVGQDVFYFQDNGAFSGFSINENNITLSKFVRLYLGRPVLQPFFAKYEFKSIQSTISQKLYTGSEISIIFSISSGNFNCFGL